MTLSSYLSLTFYILNYIEWSNTFFINIVLRLAGLISFSSDSWVIVYFIIGYNDYAESNAINYGFNE